MKIAIVAAHFMPEIGYKEVIMANVLARQGHVISVITTTDSPSKSRKLLAGGYRLGKSIEADGMLVWRLPHRWIFGSMVFAENAAILYAISEVQPDIVIVIGVGKMFPNQIILPATDRRYGLITFFGDHGDYFPDLDFRQNLVNLRVWLIKKLVKNRAVRRAIAASDLIVGYTPDTFGILNIITNKALSKRLLERYFQIPLGYDSKDYYYDSESRKRTRDKLGITDEDVFLITVTRLTPSKQIELAIDAVSKLSDNHLIKYYIVGSLGDAYSSKLQSLIQSYKLQDIVVILPFMHSKEKLEYYCASDIGIWATAAITIQEAMGTGLKILLPDKPSVAHLITNGLNGWIENSVEDGLSRAIAEVEKKNSKDREHERKGIEIFNNKFLSYDNIMNSVLTEYAKK